MPSPPFVPSPPPGAGGMPPHAQPLQTGHAVAPAGLVLDAGALARLAELDPNGESQLLQRVMKTFLTSAARLSGQLEAGRASGDRAAIRLVAHTLKSSAGYIGALQLARCCVGLESATAQAEFSEVEQAIHAMREALSITLEAVSRRLHDAP